MNETSLGLLFILLVAFLAASAFFSGSETAFMSLSRPRLKHLAETLPRRAKLIERMIKKPERLIGTILVGNNLVNVAMSAIAAYIAIEIYGRRGIAYATAFLTLIIVIFAEITPKIFAKYFDERVCIVTAPVLNLLIKIFRPVVVLVTSISNGLLSLIGVDVSKRKRPPMTEAEILTYIKMGWLEGALTDEERRMLTRVFTLNDKTVKDIMVPKEEIVFLSLDTPIEAIKQTVLETGYSRFPVVTSVGSEEIAGYLHTKDLFKVREGGSGPETLKEILRPPYFIPSYKKIDAQLLSFKQKRFHQALVRDEQGRVIGLITLEDILEELVGEIEDEHDELERS